MALELWLYLFKEGIMDVNILLKIEKAEDEKQKNVKLYRSLGVIIGFVIIIIFI